MEEKLDIFEEQTEDVSEQEPEREDPQPEADIVEETGEKEPEVPPTPEEPKEPQNLPLSAVLDEREKRQEAQRKAEEAERRAAELQRKLEDLSAKPQAEPDWFDDPATAYEQRHRKYVLSQSKFLADREFGKDVVEEAFAFFDRPENHALTHKFVNHPSPFHAAVDEYKRLKFASEIEDPDKWREAERERIRAELAAEKPQPSKPTAPPPSMSAKPSSAGQTQPRPDVPPDLAGLFG